VAISGALAATFLFAIGLPAAYAVLALVWFKVKPTWDSAFKLMSNAVALAASFRLIWLVFFEEVSGLSSQAKYYLLVGIAATGWYGIAGILKTFNKLFQVKLERVMNLGGNRIEMRIPQSVWFPRDLSFRHS
jgi:hypothetical protein